MSWSYECASLAMGGESHVLTLRITGRRWFCVVNKTASAMIAAPAAENDGESGANKIDAAASKHIEAALAFDLHPRHTYHAEIAAWCHGGAWGDFGGLLLDRKLLKETVDDLELAADVEVTEWRFAVVSLMSNERRLILRAGDAVAVVMGLDRSASLPRLRFLDEVAP